MEIRGLGGFGVVHLAEPHCVADADLVFVAGDGPLPAAAAVTATMTAPIA